MSGLYLHSRCHMGAPTRAVLESANTLRIECAVCRMTVTTLHLREPIDVRCSSCEPPPPEPRA